MKSAASSRSRSARSDSLCGPSVCDRLVPDPAAAERRAASYVASGHAACPRRPNSSPAELAPGAADRDSGRRAPGGAAFRRLLRGRRERLRQPGAQVGRSPASAEDLRQQGPRRARVAVGRDQEAASSPRARRERVPEPEIPWPVFSSFAQTKSLAPQLLHVGATLGPLTI